jgi:regulator of RNase E activity RraA
MQSPDGPADALPGGSRAVARLLRLDSCALSDALDALGLSGAVTGLRAVSVHTRIAGRVRTVKLGPYGGIPARRHLGTAAIEAALPGEVIVVEQRTGIEAAGWGGILSSAARARGIAGVIVEGPARDVDEASEIGFPVYARFATCRTARGRIAEVASGEPVIVGGITVEAGDLVLADGSGTVFLRAAEADRVLAEAERIAAHEAFMTKEVLGGAPVSRVMGADYESMLARDA